MYVHLTGYKIHKEKNDTIQEEKQSNIVRDFNTPILETDRMRSTHGEI